MAFTIANFSPIGGQGRQGKAPQLFSYGTLDTHATVDASGYFNSVAGQLHIGDVIFVTVFATAIGDGGTVSTYGTHIVNAKSAAGVIDVTNVSVHTVVDSD
jgi:hypothetical protein